MKTVLEGGDLVSIRIRGQLYAAKVWGVLNKFPTVQVTKINYSEEFSKNAIIRSINQNRPLIG